jgi:ATP-dependent Clp protease, protease subunit
MARTLSVPYNIPGSQSWQWINIYTRLNQERILFLNEAITDGLANAIVSALLYLDSDEQKPIYLYINSSGDLAGGQVAFQTAMASVTGVMAIYDTMQHIKSEVTTICLGQARGMAALLLSCGVKGKRASLPNARLALNYPRTLTRGQATDIQVDAKEVLAKRRSIIELLSKNTGQPTEKIERDMERMFYMTAQEAQEYGLIDRVLTSSKAIAPQTVPALI